MPALAEGTKAPALVLPGLDGQPYNLQAELKRSPVVLLAFFKVSCPVCQFEFPYIERLHRSYRTLPIWGISQDDADATTAFARMYGCTFPMLLDEKLSSTVDYDLTNVPSVFLVGDDQVVKQTVIGFVKAELEQINEALAKCSNTSPVPLFTSADEVPSLRPG